ncbi:MAG TPA: transposase [Burkholderiales bacterium]|nr:transposase [Burkholderiales bacterium]
MPNYRRLVTAHRTIFFTVAAANRRSAVLTDHIEQLRVAVDITRRMFPFAIDAWVVLPDHLHCIWTMPENDSDFSERWRTIKARFSSDVSASACLSRRQLARGERGIWQRRFWDHVIRDEADFAAHFDYIHNNPVKHGHVERAVDWPFSTFHRYVRAGIYPFDWGCELGIPGDYGE